MLWTFMVVVLVFAALWIVLGKWSPKTSLEMSAVVLLFVAANIGTIWMLYVSIRFEKHPFAFVLLAFVPYAFLWYYFERVRLRKHLTRGEA